MLRWFSKILRNSIRRPWAVCSRFPLRPPKPWAFPTGVFTSEGERGCVPLHAMTIPGSLYLFQTVTRSTFEHIMSFEHNFFRFHGLRQRNEEQYIQPWCSMNRTNTWVEGGGGNHIHEPRFHLWVNQAPKTHEVWLTS